MIQLAVAGVVVLSTFVGALGGLWLGARLPKHHLDGDSRDTVKLVVGLVATMSALVLGLLIASAQTFYDNQNTELQTLSVNLVELDHVLFRYGPEAADARAILHRNLATAIARLWPKRGTWFEAPVPLPLQPPAGVTTLLDAVEGLQPATEAQRALQARAVRLTSSAAQTRLLMAEQAQDPISWPFLATLDCWGVFLFFGFGLLTRRNATVVVTLLVGALALGSAAFLILELSSPLRGLMRISPAPLHAALAQMQP